MAFMLSDITNQKSVKVFLGEGERDAVMLGIKYLVLDDERWGELVDSLTPPKSEEDEENAQMRFLDTLRRHKAAVKEICHEVTVQSDSGLQLSLLVSETDADGKPLRDEAGKRVTKRIEANLKKGDALEGEVFDAFISFMPTVQQIFDYYSKHVQNVHQRDKKK